MALLDPLANAPRPQKIVAGIVGLVIVAALGYFLLISPKSAERDALRQQNEALQAEVMKARADEANLRPFRAQAEALRKRLEAAKERLPSEREIPAAVPAALGPGAPVRARRRALRAEAARGPGRSSPRCRSR